VKRLRNILAVIGAIVLLLTAFKLTQVYYENKIEKGAEDLRKQIIKNSELIKESEGHYSKIVADSMRKKELLKIIDSLKIKADNPAIVERIVVKPKDSEKEIPEVTTSDSLIYFTDYYPSILDPYITYSARLNLFTKKYTGSFRFKKIPISIIVNQEAGGLSKANIIVPDFLEVESYDFQSTRLNPQTTDEFGWLVGAGYFNDILSQREGAEFTAGARYKKAYLLGSVQTNGTVGLKTLIEF
jgi:hypothetical protein